MKKSLFIKTTVALALAAPLLASAESELVTGNATVGGAVARLNFQVVIPAFISLRVGTAGTGVASIDTVEFNLTDAQAATSGAYAADVNPSVEVALLSNVGDIALSSLGAPLADGANTIPLSTIAVTSDNSNLPHPGFNTSTTINPSAGRIVNRTANWSFEYNHDATTVGDGTYTTQVIYTATRL